MLQCQPEFSWLLYNEKCHLAQQSSTNHSLTKQHILYGRYYTATNTTAAAAADTTITTTILHLVPFFSKLPLPYILNWRLCFSNTL